MASLGPWGAEVVIEFLNVEYPRLNPRAKIQVDSLLSGIQKSLRLTLNA